MSKEAIIRQDIDRFLDGFLSEHEEVRTNSSRDDFKSQWYSYEDEYSYNFCGLD